MTPSVDTVHGSVPYATRRSIFLLLFRAEYCGRTSHFRLILRLSLFWGGCKLVSFTCLPVCLLACLLWLLPASGRFFVRVPVVGLCSLSLSLSRYGPNGAQCPMVLFLFISWWYRSTRASPRPNTKTLSIRPVLATVSWLVNFWFRSFCVHTT